MSDNTDRIARLRAEADQLEAQDKAFSALKDNEKLAIQLHGMLCHSNHIDGCGWDYEMLTGNIDDWSGGAHGRYLGKANNIINACDHRDINPRSILAMVKILRES